MRVLWFSNAPLPAVQRHRGEVPAGSGQWMTCMLEHLRAKAPRIQVEVATAHPGLDDDEFEEAGVRYHVFAQPRRLSIFDARPRDLERCARLVAERQPDLIHIHGSERFFGLLAARRLVATPTVIAIQGLAEACLPVFFGALSPSEIWRSHRTIELASGRGPVWRYRDFLRGARLGREVLAGAKFFMGRTAWDHAQVRAANPGAKYFHVGEILRRPFTEARWDLNRCERHSVVFTNGGCEPRRGMEVLIRAMALVRREFPDARLRIAGVIGTRRGYERFLRGMIAGSGLSDSVEFLGYLDAEQMAGTLERSHVFAMPSFMENSSNSLCEAMQVGLPSIAAYTGGIPSLMEDGASGRLLPAGDVALLAQTIREIFLDDEQAARLGRAAREAATARHAPERVIGELLAAYSAISGEAALMEEPRAVGSGSMLRA